MSSAVIRAHVYVSGRVQGVFFRDTTQRTASSIGGLTGWVRNLHDGRVEIVVEGSGDKVEQLIRFAHTGPPAASVQGVDVRKENPTGEFRGFVVRH